MSGALSLAANGTASGAFFEGEREGPKDCREDIAIGDHHDESLTGCVHVVINIMCQIGICQQFFERPEVTMHLVRFISDVSTYPTSGKLLCTPVVVNFFCHGIKHHGEIHEDDSLVDHDTNDSLNIGEVRLFGFVVQIFKGNQKRGSQGAIFRIVVGFYAVDISFGHFALHPAFVVGFRQLQCYFSDLRGEFSLFAVQPVQHVCPIVRSCAFSFVHLINPP